MSATLRIGDKTYDVEVSEIEFSSDGGYLNDNFSSPYQHNVTFAQTVVELTGTVRGITIHVADEEEEINRKEPEMGYPREESCGTACDGEYQPLSKKVVDLDLNEDDRLLRKYRVVSDSGTLTGNGSEVLLNVLFKENKAAVVKALKALEAAEKK